MFYHVACARKFTTSLKSRDVVERSVGGVASFGWRDLEGIQARGGGTAHLKLRGVRGHLRR